MFPLSVLEGSILLIYIYKTTQKDNYFPGVSAAMRYSATGSTMTDDKLTGVDSVAITLTTSYLGPEFPRRVHKFDVLS